MGRVPILEFVEMCNCATELVPEGIVSLLFDTIISSVKDDTITYECRDLNGMRSKIIVGGKEQDITVAMSDLTIRDFSGLAFLKFHCPNEDDVPVKRIKGCLLLTENVLTPSRLISTKTTVMVTRFCEESYDLPDDRVTVVANGK